MKPKRSFLPSLTLRSDLYPHLIVCKSLAERPRVYETTEVFVNCKVIKSKGIHHYLSTYTFQHCSETERLYLKKKIFLIPPFLPVHNLKSYMSFLYN